ncbi:hypothetical protein PAXRUDRAFT_21877 [Paxillus rubicundulus Ve08.2h10]|uniref:Uncharacterized protein n=1 Tax=Paxillus rubicundulus Ve08.2h10 TaxID=930991 RepID=A0A0D0CYL0_9AGAM|nr:hypothetical protein PAXRUDRAFT_21877 [Paxillus rubicundulus Ve08.2h10]
MTTPLNLRPTVSAQESDPESAKMQGYHSRSSSCHTPASESGNSSSNFTVTSWQQFPLMKTETRLAKLESKQQKQEHEKWIHEQEAAEADCKRELKLTLALEKTEQLKLELELEHSRERQLMLGGGHSSMDV